MFKSGLKSGDYHDEMNTRNYCKWVKEKLVPNLPQNSVIVIDNASYHNTMAEKLPTSSTRKFEMIEWLKAKGIPYEEKSTKSELYDIIKKMKEGEKKYVIDSILEENGHNVLRLPPYHPELNQIEKIWALVKGKVSSNNVTFKMNDVLKLAKRAIEEVTQENWQKVCNHVEKQETAYIEEEHLFDSYIDSFIITGSMIDSDSSSEDTDSDVDLQ